MILIFGTHLQYLYKSTHEDQDFQLNGAQQSG